MNYSKWGLYWVLNSYDHCLFFYQGGYAVIREWLN